MSIAIRVEKLSKDYAIGSRQASPDSLRELLSGALRFPFGRHRGEASAGAPRTFRALDDVSFEVERGSVVGIIGRNGAGKSTLLKILSRITPPTSGRAVVEGRVGSLLEVGTGFHPELTGRENVYLNGAILGMRRAEIRAKFDEIVAFAEVEKFLDTPVKRYSSGMYVRLAFAVAAHLDPEILIVDEVLSVGDAQFQRKCMGKMGDAAGSGRTILFVSHNMGAIRRLCGRAVWLADGKVRQAGDAGAVADGYMRDALRGGEGTDIRAALDALPEDPVFRMKDVRLSQGGSPCVTALNGSPVDLSVRYSVREPVKGLRIYFDLIDDEGNILVRSFNDEDADAVPVTAPGEYVSSATIPAGLLAPREYELRVYGTIHNVRSIPPGGVGISLPVEASTELNRAYPREPVRARLQPRIAWRVEPAAIDG